MKIAIFGSCVSRDTAEFLSEAEVVTYVARHSVTSLQSPRGAEKVDLSALSSEFQKRMVTFDLNGAGLSQILTNSKDIDIVLLDLVDERRGYWQFPDRTTMTNSLEVESCGAAREASCSGARLVEFGTDEHFNRWKAGYTKLVKGLKDAELWEKTLLLDIEWAAAVEGAQHPQNDRIARIGRQWRRIQRGSREASRELSQGRGVGEAWHSLRNVKPTEAEEFANRALAANESYLRYRKVARSLTASTVMRKSSDVRIGQDHKWGPQPFHYRRQDYASIAEEIRWRTTLR